MNWEQYFYINPTKPEGTYWLTLRLNNKGIGSESQKAGDVANQLQKYLVAHRSEMQIKHDKGDVKYRLCANLELAENQLTSEGCRKILSVFSSNKVQCKALRLYRNQLDDRAVAHIADLIVTQAEAVEELHISNNKITERGIMHLLLALKFHPNKSYPFRSRNNPTSWNPLWLRLENNHLMFATKMLSLLKDVGGLHLCTATEVFSCTPAKCSKAGASHSESPLVHLFQSDLHVTYFKRMSIAFRNPEAKHPITDELMIKIAKCKSMKSLSEIGFIDDDKNRPTVHVSHSKKGKSGVIEKMDLTEDTRGLVISNDVSVEPLVPPEINPIEAISRPISNSQKGSKTVQCSGNDEIGLNISLVGETTDDVDPEKHVSRDKFRNHNEGVTAKNCFVDPHTNTYYNNHLIDENHQPRRTYELVSKKHVLTGIISQDRHSQALVIDEAEKDFVVSVSDRKMVDASSHPRNCINDAELTTTSKKGWSNIDNADIGWEKVSLDQIVTRTGNVIASMMCHICLGFLIDPCVGSCGHRFCKFCFISYKKRYSTSSGYVVPLLSLPCPAESTMGCTRSLKQADVKPLAPHLVVILSRTIIRCRYGCRSLNQIPINLLDRTDTIREHVLSDPFNPLSASVSSQPEVDRNELSPVLHQTSLFSEPLRGQICIWEGRLSDYLKHLKMCPMRRSSFQGRIDAYDHSVAVELGQRNLNENASSNLIMNDASSPEDSNDNREPREYISRHREFCTRQHIKSKSVSPNKCSPEITDPPQPDSPTIGAPHLRFPLATCAPENPVGIARRTQHPVHKTLYRELRVSKKTDKENLTSLPINLVNTVQPEKILDGMHTRTSVNNSVRLKAGNVSILSRRTGKAVSTGLDEINLTEKHPNEECESSSHSFQEVGNSDKGCCSAQNDSTKAVVELPSYQNSNNIQKIHNNVQGTDRIPKSVSPLLGNRKSAPNRQNLWATREKHFFQNRTGEVNIQSAQDTRDTNNGSSTGAFHVGNSFHSLEGIPSSVESITTSYDDFRFITAVDLTSAQTVHVAKKISSNEDLVENRPRGTSKTEALSQEFIRRGVYTHDTKRDINSGYVCHAPSSGEFTSDFQFDRSDPRKYHARLTDDVHESFVNQFSTSGQPKSTTRPAPTGDANQRMNPFAIAYVAAKKPYEDQKVFMDPSLQRHEYTTVEHRRRGFVDRMNLEERHNSLNHSVGYSQHYNEQSAYDQTVFFQEGASLIYPLDAHFPRQPNLGWPPQQYGVDTIHAPPTQNHRSRLHLPNQVEWDVRIAVQDFVGNRPDDAPPSLKEDSFLSLTGGELVVIFACTELGWAAGSKIDSKIEDYRNKDDFEFNFTGIAGWFPASIATPVENYLIARRMAFS